MMGLLDYQGENVQQQKMKGLLGSDWEDPRTMAVLNMAAQLLDASGPSPQKIGIGQALGRGMQGYTSGMKAGQDMQNSTAKLAIEKKKAEMEAKGGAPYYSPFFTNQGPVSYSHRDGVFRKGTVEGADGSVTPLQYDPMNKGRITSAEEGAKADFDLVEVVSPDGMKYKVPKSALVGGAGMPGMPSTPAQQFGGQPQPMQRPQQMGQQQIPTERPPAQNEFDKQTGKDEADAYTKIQEGGRAAGKQIATLSQLDSLLGDFEGGKLSPMGLEFARAANSLGWNVDKNLANKEASLAIGNELALQLRNPAGGAGMPGALSDSDRNFLTSMVPSMTQSAEGRRKLISMKTSVAKREEQVAELSRKWVNRYGRMSAPDQSGKTFQDYLGMWADKNRLFQEQ